MKNRIIAFFIGALLSFTVTASEGLISLESDFSVAETTNRFISIIEKKGLTLFDRIKHQQNASNADLELRPTEVVIFGNPKVGTPLMQCSQQVAIDLPQKALIWQDAKGKIWFSYNDPRYLQQRHGIQGCDRIIQKITTVLEKLSKAATMQ